MCKNNPLFSIKFCFVQHTYFVSEKLCFPENTIKIVFSAKHSFSKTQLAKPTFTHVKKHLFPKKGVIFGFGPLPLKPQFLQFVQVYTVLGHKNFLARTECVHENARFFSLPDTNSVRHLTCCRPPVFLQTERVATRFAREFPWKTQHNLADSDEARCNACSADGKRCNAFRLKKPDYATFSREMCERNALQRVSPANFPGKRSIIWLLQTKHVATPALCRNTLA